MEEGEMPTRSWSISPEVETAKCPVEDCNISVDITLKSIDEITFGAHQKNLEFYSQGFPIAGSTVATEVVQLQEKADVLRIMLIFMHNTRLPDLNKLEFSIISPLAEAAEKYMIYSAIALCRIKMEQEVKKHPVEVFMYSAKHGYPSLADTAAQMTLDLSTTEFLRLAQTCNINQDITFRWCRYRDLWLDTLFRRVLTTDGLSPCLASGSHKKGKTSCNLWHKFHLQVIKHIGQKLTELSRFGDVLERSRAGLDVCSECRSNIEIWRRQVQAAVQKMPNFSNA